MGLDVVLPPTLVAVVARSSSRPSLVLACLPPCFVLRSQHVGNGFLSCWLAFCGSVWFASTAGFSGAATFAHMQKALERPVAENEAAVSQPNTSSENSAVV